MAPTALQLHQLATTLAFALCLLLVVEMTALTFAVAPGMAHRLHQGSRNDTGIFPKRSTNVNAWYQSTADDKSTSAYPLLFQQSLSGPSTAYNPGKPARIGIARTTACPIFRAQDDGSTDPLLIG